jgi:uncharacterized phage protein (TIGR01671 family)
MNERHLFRGKVTRDCDLFKCGDWIEGQLYCGDDTCRIILGASFKRGGGFSADARLISPKTLGQCTGLRDKNGTLIFEGDILCYEGIPPVKVEYRNGTWYAHDVELYDFVVLIPQHAKRLCGKEITPNIIGNIHDNPELLNYEKRGVNL